MEYITESLPQAKSVEQMKMVRRLSKSTDIGDKIHPTGANLLYDTNVIDTGIESYQDYMANNNRGFDDNSTNKIKPATNYIVPQVNGYKSEMKKKK